MMKQEFEKLAGLEISTEDYENVVEPMYMATDMNKEDFVKFILPSVKPMAKKLADEKQKANEHPVFISNGLITPNGAYYIGRWMMLEETKVNVRTGMRTFAIRDLTIDEQHATGWDSNMASHVDIYANDDDVKFKVA